MPAFPEPQVPRGMRLRMVGVVMILALALFGVLIASGVIGVGMGLPRVP